jgi:hypothetical protein
MSRFGRGLRLTTIVIGLAGLAACAQMGDTDRAMIEQARADAQAAEAAADRATAAANEAADAASTAQMAMERQERMVQQSMRK